MTTFNLTPEMATSNQAHYLFDDVCETGFQKMWRKLRKQAASTMATLQEIVGDVDVVSSENRGGQRVSLDKVCGTVSTMRSSDFDADFRPRRSHLKSRWVRIAEGFLNQANMPPVNLVECNGRYFVNDGHHRVSVAKSLGRDEIWATVTTWNTVIN